MDRKSIIIVALSVALLLGWYPLTNYIWGPPPPRTTQQLAPTNAPLGGTNISTVSNGVATAVAAVSGTETRPTTAASTLLVAPNTPEQTEVLAGDDVRYTFTSHGGGIKLVELTKYPHSVGSKTGTDTNKFATLNTKAPTPAMALLGGSVIEGDGIYKLTKTGNSVRAEKLVGNEILIVKEFTVGTNYLLHTKVTIENRSTQTVRLPAQTVIFGTATPQTAHETEATTGFIWYNGKKDVHEGTAWFANRFLGCFPGTPRSEYLAGDNDVKWAAVHNQFFTMAAVPKEAAPQVVSRQINLPPPTEAERAADPRAIAAPHGFQTGFVYPQANIAANSKIEREYDLFTGPREYNTLARQASKYNNNLDLVMNFGGFFGFFAKALLLSMNALASWGLSYGWAIVVITVTIKLVFWPLTHASTKSMKRMAALAPELKKIQDKYKDDPQKLTQKQFELWREHKVNPFGSCIPMVLQIPVFFGFFRMLQTAIELRGAEFLWVMDLSQSDTVFVIPGINFPINPMPLLMGVTMLWQAQITPASPTMDPVQQKIMKYMPLMFLVFLYNFSAGLTLYWTVNNLLTILQTKMTNTDPVTPTPEAAKLPAAPVKKKK
ncbi:MAG: rane protein insertase, YidC/Oxa1 family [Verrucomicrobia bacterium]|nr:rane protein insertase, YidC/Oxa1 family [Verrucomicrobiota bacterium]